MDLYIARHGQTLSNIGMDSSHDSALTELGKKQVDYLGEYMAAEELDCIIASPLQRAVMTAQAVASHQSKPVTVEIWPELMEFGTPAGYEGLPMEQLRAICPSAVLCPLTKQTALPEETWEQGLLRGERVVAALRERFPKEGQKVFLAAHGHFNNHLLHAATGLAWHDHFNFSQYNAGVSLVRFIIWQGEPHTQFTYFNAHGHIPPELRTGV